MARKQFLRELLAEDQEPFHLNIFIADRRRSQLNNPPSLHLRKRRPPPALRRHACFLSFQNSPDARKSPLFVPPSPAKSPRLHVPSRTAALLVEAAMRIQKHHQQQPRPKAHGANTIGLGLFGSILKRLKDRSSRSKRRVIGDSDLKASNRNATLVEEDVVRVSVSCSCSNNWTENNEDNKSLDFDDSTSDCGSECFGEISSDFNCRETRFCPSPFVFSLERGPSSPGRRTPDFCSPAASPTRRVNQDKDNYNSRNSDNVQEEEEEEEADKEQCSPVSVLDNTPYEDDEEHENRDTDDYMMKCSYENVQRARQQLLYRLQRFEKLAELDTTELERDVLQGSDDEDGDEQLPMYEKQSTVENILTQVFDQSNLGYNSRNVSPDMKRLVHDLIVEENGEVAFAENNEVLISRICRILDSWREVEPNTIDMMVGFDFKGEFGRWTKFDEQLGDVSTEIELAIYGLLVEEISDELVNMDGKCLQF